MLQSVGGWCSRAAGTLGHGAKTFRGARLARRQGQPQRLDLSLGHLRSAVATKAARRARPDLAPWCIVAVQEVAH